MSRVLFEEIPVEEWDRLMAVNLRGVFLCCRAVVPYMKRQRRGKIVNISSGTVFYCATLLAHYVTSKAGVIGFTRSLARELGEYNINVNAIAPGYVATELLTGVSDEVMKSIVGQIPVGRLGEADEVARCVTFLAADEAGWITGSTLTINGGQFMD